MRIRKIIAGLLAALLLTGAAAAAETASGADSPDFEMSVELGFDGRITYGKVIPVRVTIRNAGGDFTGLLGVNGYVDKKHYDRFETEVVLPAGSEKTYTLPLKAFVRQDEFTVELTRDGKTVKTATAAPTGVINPSAALIGVLTSRPKQLAYLNLNRDNDPLYRYEQMETVALTPETLPSDPELLNSFGILVLDDADSALLNESQRTALRSWLEKGRVLLVSGGAEAGRNLAFLNEWTGLSLKGTRTETGVIPALETGLNVSWSGEDPEILIAEAEGARPLITDAVGTGLLYRTEAGAGRIYTAAFSLTDPAVTGASLTRFFWQQVLLTYDNDAYSRLLYTDYSNPDAVVFTGITAPLGLRGPMVPAALIAAASLLLGCALWMILKKKDLRQWMWLGLPVIALAAGAGIWLLSLGSELNEPVAAAGVNVVQDTAGAVRRYAGITAAMPEYGVHSFTLEKGSLTVRNYDYAYYDEESEETTKVPYVLRNTYTSGEVAGVRINLRAPWEAASLIYQDEPDPRGRVEASVWMESDGLRGTIRNATGWSLGEGWLITPYGWMKVKALAPGESAEITMARGTFADPTDPKYEDGILYLTGHPDVYTLVMTALGVKDGYTVNSEQDEMSSMMTQAIGQLNGDKRARKKVYYYDAIPFVYQAPAEDRADLGLRVDGKPVRHQKTKTLYTAEAEYLPVGATGILFHPAGTDEAVRCTVDASGAPAEDMDNVSGVYYHTLNEKPTFRVHPEGIAQAEITGLTVTMEEYYAEIAACFAWDPEAKAWKEIRLNEPVEDPARWLDEEGNLYLQFRNKTAGESYNDIATPMITLEGRVRNAEH